MPLHFFVDWAEPPPRRSPVNIDDIDLQGFTHTAAAAASTTAVGRVTTYRVKKGDGRSKKRELVPVNPMTVTVASNYIQYIDSIRKFDKIFWVPSLIGAHTLVRDGHSDYEYTVYYCNRKIDGLHYVYRLVEVIMKARTNAAYEGGRACFVFVEDAHSGVLIPFLNTVDDFKPKEYADEKKSRQKFKK